LNAVLRRLLLAVSAALAASVAFAVPLASATTGHSLAGAFGGPGLANGLFSPGPAGIGVLGASGELFVADSRNGEAPYGRVQRFDASGGFVSSFAFADAPVAAYQKASALAVDPSGSGAVYVLGRLSGAAQEDVLKFSASGTFEYLLDQAGSGTTFNVDGGEALAVDPANGTVYVSATDGTEAPVVDRFDGSTGAFIDSINGSSSPEGAFFCRLTGLAVGASHDLFVLDPCKGPYGNGQVDRFAADGTFGAIVDDGSRGAPRAVAVDPVSDEVYVAQEAAEQPGQMFGLVTPHVTQFAAGGGAAVSTFDLGSAFSLAGQRGVVGMAARRW
jgi:DNA-binding beta-propeller fold protein YncE